MNNHLQNHNGTHRGCERGSVLVFVALTLFVIVGMIGLAIDAGHMYAAKQRAIAAADAAAQAAAMNVYRGSSDNGSASAVWYAQQNGFNTAADTVTVTYPSCSGLPWCNGHVTLSGIDTPNLVEVTVSRTVNTTLMRVLGRAASTVSATANAAIVLAPAPLPVIVTHPTLSNVVDTGGNKSAITVCGGPQRAFQINSSSPTALNNPSIDLSRAGPLSDGSCADPVTGADFANVGGPAAQPTNVNLGVDGSYDQPASQIPDPLAGVNPPPMPATAPARTTVTGTNGCPIGRSCYLYSPGKYPNADGPLDVKNSTALFKPGIYYISSGGFTNDTGGTMLMATGFTDGATGTNTGWTYNILVYNSGPAFAPFFFKSNSNAANLAGAPPASVYKGILFFQDRNSPAMTHSFTGQATLTLTGTIYITNTLAIMQATPGQYQLVSFGGGSGSGTIIQGEIITSAILMNGNTTITMHLTSTPTRDVRQVALVR